MNRPTEKRQQSGDLPSFLDASTNAEERAEDAPLDDGYDEEEGQEDYDDEQLSGVDDEYDEDEDGEDLDEQEDDADADDDPAGSSRRAARVERDAATSVGGGFAMLVGLALTVAAFVVTVVPALASQMIGFAIEPQIVLLMGIAVFAIGAGQRRVGRMQRRLDELEGERQGRDDELRETLTELLQNQRDGQPALGDGNELQRALLSLQRQDEKINNLTRAIKMYGKPLMEIANQGTELASQIGQLRQAVEGNREATRQSFAAVEQRLADAGKGADLGELPGQIDRLEVSVAAITQRLEDTEVRKSLVRLEDSGKQLHEELKTLQRGDSVRAAAEDLQQKLTTATRDLSNGIAQLRDGNLGALEGTVRDIQREVSGLATGVAQIQAAVKNGARAAATPSPATSASAAPTPTPKPTADAGPAPTTSADDASGDDSGYATGKRKSTGKNVLGAIAKLKQMKG